MRHNKPPLAGPVNTEATVLIERGKAPVVDRLVVVVVLPLWSQHHPSFPHEPNLQACPLDLPPSKDENTRWVYASPRAPEGTRSMYIFVGSPPTHHPHYYRDGDLKMDECGSARASQCQPQVHGAPCRPRSGLRAPAALHLVVMVVFNDSPLVGTVHLAGLPEPSQSPARIVCVMMRGLDGTVPVYQAEQYYRCAPGRHRLDVRSGIPGSSVHVKFRVVRTV